MILSDDRDSGSDSINTDCHVNDDTDAAAADDDDDEVAIVEGLLTRNRHANDEWPRVSPDVPLSVYRSV
jgi:hypothetical protein